MAANRWPCALLTPAILAGLLSAAPAHAVTIDWVSVGDPGNPADTASNCLAASCGSVGYEYSISKYEVTNAQYVEFLNAKAASDPLGLYDSNMTSSTLGGITRSGVSGSYSYGVKTGMGDRPVVFVSFYDAARFANWLDNGQGSGDTETGAYTLLGGTPTPSNGTSVTRSSGANVFLPSENEWYKAAYYDGDLGVYYDYPAGMNAPTLCSAPTATANRQNCWPEGGGALTAVGAYTGSASPYGTFDQAGNVWEWNEQAVAGGVDRGMRGSSLFSSAGNAAATYAGTRTAASGGGEYGFRVATIPEPGTLVLLGSGLAGLARYGRRRRA